MPCCQERHVALLLLGHRVDVDAERLELEARDLAVDLGGHDVDAVASSSSWFFATYSAESAWPAKLMSMTAAGWPSAAPRLTSRPSAMT